jgi:hypothetical protein
VNRYASRNVPGPHCRMTRSISRIIDDDTGGDEVVALVHGDRDSGGGVCPRVGGVTVGCWWPMSITAIERFLRFGSCTRRILVRYLPPSELTSRDNSNH